MVMVLPDILCQSSERTRNPWTTNTKYRITRSHERRVGKLPRNCVPRSSFVTSAHKKTLWRVARMPRRMIRLQSERHHTTKTSRVLCSDRQLERLLPHRCRCRRSSGKESTLLLCAQCQC